MKQKTIFISGVFYNAIQKYIVVLISLVVSAILARIISPEDFGVFAIANVFLVFFSMFFDLGFGAAITQYKHLSNDEIVDIFSLSVYISIVISGIFFLISPIVSVFYNNDKLIILFKILSINLLFSSLNNVPDCLFYKHKRFKFLAIRTISIQMFLGIVSSIAAMIGFGVYTLMINPVLGAIILFCVNYLSYPIKFRFKFNFSTIQKIFSYSIFHFLYKSINYFSRSLDNLLIGKFMGMELLGYYEKSYKLMGMPTQMISNVISRVIHPVFSDYGDDKKRIYDNYLKIIDVLAGIGLPLSIFMFFTAEELILLIFGTSWIASVSIFRILSISVGLQVIVASFEPICMVTGNSRFLFFLETLKATIMIIGICLGIFLLKSLDFTAIFISIAILINFCLSCLLTIKILLHQSLYLFLLKLVKPLLCTVCCGISLFLYGKYFNGPLLLSFGFKALIFCIIFILTNFKLLKHIVTKI
jgi:PST family polysaccharide transporter